VDPDDEGPDGAVLGDPKGKSLKASHPGYSITLPVSPRREAAYCVPPAGGYQALQTPATRRVPLRGGYGGPGAGLFQPSGGTNFGRWV
jgi:hypothetical protein